jgi:uncharacterized SAM-binding protein YcdF (DUF218 family)
MLFYLSKTLPLVVLPLGVTMWLMVCALIWRSRRFLSAALLLLWISSMPAVANGVWNFVEGEQIRATASDAPTADAIVVLSGGRVVAPGPAAISDWGDPDRFFGGIELFKAGKAPRLMFTGGATPSQPNDPAEGDILRKWAIEFGVPEASVSTTGRVVNTLEEARAVAQQLGGGTRPGRVLLVTSAFHMPRAARVFRASGLEVQEFPVDFAGRGGFGILDLLPAPGALSVTQVALRELYGRAFYALWPL